MEFAEQLRIFSEAGKRIPVDVWRIPGKLGIEAKKVLLPKGISGMLERKASGFLISVEERDPETRQRFTLAHELGHYVFHSYLLKVGEGIDDDRIYRSTEAGKYHNTQIGQDEEVEANRFAASLLMPMEAIRHYEKVLGDDVPAMAKLFQVSQQTMKIRLGLS